MRILKLYYIRQFFLLCKFAVRLKELPPKGN